MRLQVMAPGGDGARVCRAAPVAALLGPFAKLDNVSRASRQSPWRITALSRSCQPLVCVQLRRWLTVTGRQSRSRQSLVPLFNSCCGQDVGIAGPARPSVPTATHWPLVAVLARLHSGLSPVPPPAPRCIFHGGILGPVPDAYFTEV